MSDVDYSRYSISEDEYDLDILNRTRIAIFTNDLLRNGAPIFGDFFDRDVDDNARLQRALDEKMQFIGPPGTHRQLYSSSGNQYDVTLTSCTCPDFKYRHSPCKHMYRLAVDYVLSLPVFPAPQKSYTERTNYVQSLPQVPSPQEEFIPSTVEPVTTVKTSHSNKNISRRPWLSAVIVAFLLIVCILGAIDLPDSRTTFDASEHISATFEPAPTATPIPTPTRTPRPTNTPSNRLTPEELREMIAAEGLIISTPTPSPVHSSGQSGGGGNSYFGEATTDEGYIGNLKSHKFHKPTCWTLPAENNQIIFATREEAIAAGYDPCGNCHP